MYGFVRKSYGLVLLLTMILLSAYRILPHHHHTLHFPETFAAAELLHFGHEDCAESGGHNDSSGGECPCEGIYYLTSFGNESDDGKYIVTFDVVAMIPVVSESVLSSGISETLKSLYANLKIPDSSTCSESLRAPPVVL